MTALEALQTALAAEHAAVYVYGALGAQTSQSTAPALFASVSSAYAEHRSRRDLLDREIRGLGGTPVASAAAYELPGGLATPAGVTRAALDLERSCASTYAWVVANTVGPRRRWAVEVLTHTAVRELVFRGTPEMLPGVDE
ncbi:MAG: hypothetical protein JWO76_2673 [Nocardioides sp.]|nr:hypothetical protein [Nocardioides sp.]